MAWPRLSAVQLQKLSHDYIEIKASTVSKRNVTYRAIFLFIELYMLTKDYHSKEVDVTSNSNGV